MTKQAIPPLLSYGAEMSRTRYWQEVQLVAIGALIAQQPRGDMDIEQYARQIVNEADVIADSALVKHGPSVSDRLQKEAPFEAAPGGKSDEEEA